MEKELTPLQETERSALCGDRSAILRLVSAVRKFREESARLVRGRYGDGAVDGVMVLNFMDAIESIEADGTDDR